MANDRWLPPFIAQAPQRLAAAFNLPAWSFDLTELAKGSTVALAVTGLSRSGKTVLITSLIHNFLSALHNPHRMPLLNGVGEGRLIAARLSPAKAEALPRFPYRANIDCMAGSAADWPARTTGLSEIGIDVRFMPAGTVGRLLGHIGGNAATLRIRIVDYPGEWLIDLPLLAQSFADWSRATLTLCRQSLRAGIAEDFLAFVAQHPPGEGASEEVAKQAHDLYCAFLIRARDQHGLSFLQPGRFLCPGTLAGVPYLWFAPLDIAEGAGAFAPDSLGALMEERFEVYKREAVGQFYETHFRHFGRQIVLVDVLRALLAGREAFEDTQRALEAILQSFRYGHGGLLGQLINGPHIDRVLFAATKADHVPDIQRDHLAALLRSMAAFPALDVRSADARIEVAALASVVSTAEEVQEIDGQRVPVVVGRPVGGSKQTKFFVGTVPIRPPRPDAWGAPFLNVPVFEPPAIEPSPVDGIPHINLDLALEFLLGDRLR
jgi:predicted YcjX-like family ATPase